MQSNGGIASVDTAATQAARTVLSGPAGGVVGARYVASSAGFENIITFDMGGTSTDVALCAPQLPLTSEGVIDSMPLRTPMIDIHTVGAGGGSLARIDTVGALLVGPQSAGADPGPACYPRERPIQKSLDELRATTTDANLVLGRLDPENFLGGSMTLDLSAGRQAVDEIARLIGGTSIEAAALDIIQVANATMERAVRRISVERGFDPRHFTMVAFGGAGPLHACDLAKALLIPRVLIPTTPGVLSALGMLAAPPTKDFSQTIMVKIEEVDSDELIGLEGVFGNLEEMAFNAMAKDGFLPSALLIYRSFDMRYVGQSFELRLQMPNNARKSSIASSFHDAHFQRYGYQQPEAPMEIVNIRVTAVADFEPPPIPKVEEGEPDPSLAVIGDKEVWFDTVPLKTSLYSRSLLKAGNIIDGPAVIFQYDTTTIIPPEWQAVVDERGNLIISYTNSGKRSIQ
jgi:N-methylhydantoinase A